MRLRAQAGLFESAGPIAVDARFGGAVRTALDASSWVELVPGWLTGARELFDRLAHAVPWQQHHRTLFGQPFLIRPRRGGASVALSPRSGDLVVMGGRCQQDWVHGVPKAPGTGGARISVNFQSAAQARRAGGVP